MEIDFLIICALRSEAAAAAARLRNAVRDRSGAFASWSGLFGGATAYVMRSGPGSANAARAAAAGLAAHRPGAVVSFGTAGAVNDEWQPGESFLAREVRWAGGAQAGVVAEAAGIIDADDRLLRLAESLGLRTGVLASVQEAIAGADAREKIRREHNADAVDWESFAVMQVAQEAGIAGFALRVISDKAGAGAIEEFRANHAACAHEGARALEAFVSNASRDPGELANNNPGPIPPGGLIT